MQHQDERRSRWVLATTLTGMFATTFPIVVLVAAIPEIAEDFGTRQSVLAWVVTAPLLAGAVAMPVLGKLGDLHGHRKVFLGGFAAATVMAFCTALAWNPASLITFRTLAQVTGAATSPTAVALIMAAFPSEKRVRAMGTWSLVAAGSPALGLVAGGPLIDLLGWRVIFGIQTGLSIVALTAAAIVLRETPAKPGVRFDVPGAATLAVTAGCGLFALQQGGDWGWTHPVVLAAAAVAPVMALLFVRIERHAPAPLLPFEVAQRDGFIRPISTLMVMQTATMGGFIMTPLFLSATFDASTSATAATMIALPGCYSLASPIGGRVGERFGTRWVLVAGASGQVVAMSLLATAAAQELWALVPVGLGTLGASSGFTRPAIAASIANTVGDEFLGIGAAGQRMANEISGAVGITAWIFVMTATGFTQAYLFGIATAVISVAVARQVRPDAWREEVPEAGPADASSAASLALET